ncbi:MAG: hypothetical protein ACR2RL_24580 [Gammaproteobacteria bacterium]
MSDPTTDALAELSIDGANLHREETFTDLRAGTIRRLTPVKTDGTPDETRPTNFVGEATLLTRMGPLPVQFPLEAESLSQAVEMFPAEMKKAVEQLNERAKEYAREEASRIVVPTAGAPDLGGMPGAMPGPGKVILK